MITSLANAANCSNIYTGTAQEHLTDGVPLIARGNSTSRDLPECQDEAIEYLHKPTLWDFATPFLAEAFASLAFLREGGSGLGDAEEESLSEDEDESLSLDEESSLLSDEPEDVPVVIQETWLIYASWRRNQSP